MERQSDDAVQILSLSSKNARLFGMDNKTLIKLIFLTTKLQGLHLKRDKVKTVSRLLLGFFNWHRNPIFSKNRMRFYKSRILFQSVYSSNPLYFFLLVQRITPREAPLLWVSFEPFLYNNKTIRIVFKKG
ncbi:hypothetical protein PN36_32195 [Candidatus Thiomargarita nelsonii]|uniref:Uncharacterized protein n=1 Tax=Candidatus Thiomargarita nelsonii TaxID=1003181 RepID=A0A0A6P503_9GAMM|nr:hypothetical protein PN36_32195 [Candidatus Thiomargarita nelsonii]